MAALGLLISSAAWAQDTQGQGTTGTTGTTGAQTQGTSTTTQTTTTTTQTTDTDTDANRPRLELTGFAGYTFNNGVNFSSSRGITTSDVNFYNSIGPKDRFSYGAGIGYDVTPNLQVGFLWSRLNSPLELRGFNNTEALAAGWSGPSGATSGGVSGGTGTGGTGTGGTGTGTGGTGTGTGGTGTGGTGTGGGTVASFPVLTTTNGMSPYTIGEMAINTFHGTIGWNFGPVDAIVRPFIFGGAGVTRYGEVNYQSMNGTSGGAAGSMTSARIQADSRFSTTWGVGVKIAPTKGLGIRIAGRWTPTRLSGGTLVSSGASGGTGNTGVTGTGTSGTGTTGTGTTGTGNGSTAVSGTNTGWWCDAYWGCMGGNKSQFLNQFSLTGGLTFRF